MPILRERGSFGRTTRLWKWLICISYVPLLIQECVIHLELCATKTIRLQQLCASITKTWFVCSYVPLEMIDLQHLRACSTTRIWFVYSYMDSLDYKKMIQHNSSLSASFYYENMISDLLQLWVCTVRTWWFMWGYVRAWSTMRKCYVRVRGNVSSSSIVDFDSLLSLCPLYILFVSYVITWLCGDESSLQYWQREQQWLH